MSAVPKWCRLKTALADDVRHGAPLEYLTLEAPECVTWLDEESTEYRPVADALCDALGELFTPEHSGQLDKFDKLARKLMLGTMTADELCEWRDIQRSALIDHCSAWARRKVEEELGR